MNKPIINKKGSLIERAAEVYDFSAHFRAPVIPADDLPPVPAVEPIQPVAPLRAAAQPVASTHRPKARGRQ